MDDTVCKKKWKVMRDGYKRCKRSEQLASGSGAVSPKKKWRHMDSLSFLDNCTSSRPTIGSIPEDEIDVTEIIEFDSTDVIEIPSTSLSGKQSKKNQELNKFLEQASENISKACDALLKERYKDNSVALQMKSLAAVINESNMPPAEVNKMLNKISTIVFAEVAKYEK